MYKYTAGSNNCFNATNKKPYGFSDLHNDTMTENIPVWISIVDRLKGPRYLSRDGHVSKIMARNQRTDIGKHCFLYRTISLWIQLPAEAVANWPCISHIVICGGK